MNFRSSTKPAAIDIDLTPLINIVFLMLIFFMLAGTLKKGDPIQAAEMATNAKLESNLFVIVMAQNGDLSVEGQKVERQALTSLLAKTVTAPTRVAIKPDSRLAAEQLLSLSELLRTAGFAEVTLIVESP